MSRQILSGLTLWLILVVAASGCDWGAAQPIEGTSTDSVGPTMATGVVVAVEGDLSAISSFSILLSDGETLVLVPQAGVLFDGEGPLSHLRDHLLSGEPVMVEFHQGADNLVAATVGDGE